MEARGQKRTDMTDELPADKRACSSLEFRPSSSNSSVQTHLHSPNSTPETHEADMDTSSSASASASASSRSDGEPDRDSPYGSCDSDDADPRHSRLRDLQRRRSSGDHSKLNSILSTLGKEDDPSGQLVALTELCEVLSFCTEDTFSSMLADSLSPLLVKLAKHEHSADIMLLAIRAITYLCDVFPRSSSLLVRHDAVPALCQRLMAVEYLDVAEQCLQALEKLSRDQPLACLQAGAILAVLNFIDFFSTSIQRVALSTVVNICKKLPLENNSLFMEAVPMLCNLLQHEDRQLVERVVLCLLKIVERASESSEMLNELCKNGLIQQVTHLISIKSRTTLSQPTYNGLIGLLVTLTSGSFVAFKALHELNISSIMKDVLSSCDLAHGEFSQNMVNGKSNQVSEVLKLLNELIPSSIPDQSTQQLLDKEAFLTSRPDLLEKIAFDMLNNLIQVVDSGANIYVSYGCLSIINKLIRLSNNDVLVSILNSSNIGSFLTGVFTRKENHVLMLALQIVETTLQKSSDVFLHSFIKEGVLFALDALLTPRKCSQSMFPVYSGAQIQLDSGARYSGKQVMRCLCYAFDRRGSQLSSETGTCKLGKDSVPTCVKHIKSVYFAPELFDTGKGVTDVLQNLRSFSDALNDLMDNPIDDGIGQNEELFRLLNHMVQKLSGSVPVSTFEFVESGIVKSLVSYASNGLILKQSFQTRDLHEQLFILQERFEVLATLFSSSFSDILVSGLPLSLVVQKLHSAFSSVENLPVVLYPTYRERSSYATVPSGCSVMHPCLRVRFSREKEEISICDFSEGILTVDPFSSVDSIEEYLKHKVVQKIISTESDSHAQQLEQMQSQLDNLPINTKFCEDSSPAVAIDGHWSSDLSELQEEEGNFPHSQYTSEQEQVADLGWSNSQETSSDKSLIDHQHPSEASTNEQTDDSAPNFREHSLPKLLLHLDGHQLEGSLTLYQAILEQQLKSQDEMVNPAKLWSRVYTITYSLAVDSMDSDSEMPFCFSASSVHKGQAYTECTSFFSRIFAVELASFLDKSSPTYDVLFLLKSLEALNRYSFHLISRKKLNDFADGRIDNLDDLKVVTRSVPQSEFVNSKLSQKLEQQMRDPSAISVGAMPAWCSQLMVSCPFMFSFEIKCNYFRLAAFGPQKNQPHVASRTYSGPSSDRAQIAISLPRTKFLVSRDSILESAARMMELHARNNRVLLEVEYSEEVGTGLGPTLEFYTLASGEFQKPGLAMWREDHGSPPTTRSSSVEDSAAAVACFGLFPRPWSTVTDTSDGVLFSEVLKKFVLLGQITARAIQDGRVLDLPFSRAFYKLILDQELSLYDIQLFDPALGRTLLEFQALSAKRQHLKEKIGDLASKLKSQYRNTNIDDLCLEFTLPGYHYVLTPDHDLRMVNLDNLEEYVKLVVDATIRSGISRQLEAFKLGFNQVFPIKHLQIFSEEELERLICGEREFWVVSELLFETVNYCCPGIIMFVMSFPWQCNELLDHIKFDHGYTASSPPVVNLLEILQEFNHEERRAFLQFVTGAPHLPPGGLSSLNPKLTIVRKHTGGSADGDLPSVMTCANYLKLPAYSSKERLREKLSYAIREGQGSFHLS